MLNGIIGGTDAHSKNFSMLVRAEGRARLAPLYDAASMLPYGFHPTTLKMATKIGGKYRIEDVYPRRWAKFTAEVQLPSARVLEKTRARAEMLPAALAKVVEARAAGLDHSTPQRLIDVWAHAEGNASES